MKILDSIKRAPFGVSAHIAAVLILSLLLWATGFPGWMRTVNAAALADFSDTLTDSDLGALSAHYFEFTTTAALDASDTIEISFDPGSGGSDDEFTLGALTFAEVLSEVGFTAVGSCTGAASEVTVATSSVSGDDQVIFTVCAGDTIAAGAISFQLGATSSPVITNPALAGSNIIRVETTNDGSAVRDTGDTRVYIIDDVVVTASVDSVFTFTIDGLPTGSSVNDSPTTTFATTTSTLIPFGTLSPNVSKVLAQRIYVTTNAANGYSVTVQQDQNLTSAVGADIDLFIDGATTSVPVAWQAPANTFNFEDTYGHFGITSTDDETSSSTTPDEWGDGTDLWAGNFEQPREVLYHDEPSSGLSATEGEGWADIGFQIEIGTLQEAATDYTNTLTYVATPVY